MALEIFALAFHKQRYSIATMLMENGGAALRIRLRIRAASLTLCTAAVSQVYAYAQIQFLSFQCLTLLFIGWSFT